MSYHHSLFLHVCEVVSCIVSIYMKRVTLDIEIDSPIISSDVMLSIHTYMYINIPHVLCMYLLAYIIASKIQTVSFHCFFLPSREAVCHSGKPK